MSKAIMHPASANDFFPETLDPFCPEEGMDGYTIHSKRAALETLSRLQSEHPNWEELSAQLDEYPSGCLKAMVVDLFESLYTVMKYRDQAAVEYIMGGNK